MSLTPVLILGFTGIKSHAADSFHLFFESTGNFSKFDVIIYNIGFFKHKYTPTTYGARLDHPTPHAIQRQNEIHQALANGKIVCFIGCNNEDYVFSRIIDYHNIGHGFIHDTDLFNKFNIKRSEFKLFLENVGATQIEFVEKNVDDVICSIYNNIVVGFCKKIDKGLLLFLPCIWGNNDISYILENLENLLKGLISYSARFLYEPPNWLQNFQFENEKNIISNIEKIKAEQLDPLNNKVQYYNNIKKILWTGGNELVNNINYFFNELKINTMIDEIYEEDMWILNNGEKIIIIEIKSKNKNLERIDISKLDEHREARQVPDMTGLLIANTFMTANSLRDKNRPFSDNEIKKAINNNIVITRTLDLCNVYDLIDKQKLNSKMFIDKIINNKGWLTLEKDELIIIT